MPQHALGGHWGPGAVGRAGSCKRAKDLSATNWWRWHGWRPGDAGLLRSPLSPPIDATPACLPAHLLQWWMPAGLQTAAAC